MIPQPHGFVFGKTAQRAIDSGHALSLGGGLCAFTLLETEAGIVPVREAAQDDGFKEMLARFSHAAAPLLSPKGKVLPQTCLMGIVNVTPDSFSSDGSVEAAQTIVHGLKLIEEGAHILDIGGESTRPGAVLLSGDQERMRLEPVLRILIPAARRHDVLVSVDTRNAETMRIALGLGADMINDITALTHDPQSASVVAAAKVPVVLMHMQGTPQTMQDNPVYQNVVAEVYAYLEERLNFASVHGLSRDRCLIDPGIGFGKTLDHNLALLRALPAFRGLGVKTMIGVSRKGFIAKLANNEAPQHRLGGSLATNLWAALCSTNVLRVHDVKQIKQALAVFQGLID